MKIKVLLQAETDNGARLWQPTEVGAVSGSHYSEATDRLAELFRELSAHDWSEDHSAESGCGGNCATCQERQALRDQ